MSLKLHGWKDFERIAGFCIRTLKTYHKRSPIPFVKSSPAKQGKISIQREVFTEWLKPFLHYKT